jgi:hypothetical protein
MFRSKPSWITNASLIALAFCASLLMFAPRPAAADDAPYQGEQESKKQLTVLRVQSSNGGYAKTKTFFAANQLKTIRFGWWTNCPGAHHGIVLVANSPDVVNYATIMKFTDVSLNAQDSQYSLFDLDLEQIIKKYYEGEVPKGKYYVSIHAVNEGGGGLGDWSNLVTIDFRRPLVKPMREFRRQIGPIIEFQPKPGPTHKFQPQAGPVRRSFKSR